MSPLELCSTLSYPSIYSLILFCSLPVSLTQHLHNICSLFLSASLSFVHAACSLEKQVPSRKKRHGTHKTTPFQSSYKTHAEGHRVTMAILQFGTKSREVSGSADINTKIEWWWGLVRVGGRMGVGGYWCIWTCGGLRCRGPKRRGWGWQVRDW